ncbi:MAG: ABC transporter substrate-binding protein [Methanosphaera sp.]|nr:ABC transporter substrate-binding protein [Methanosphaera sp.]
MQRIKKQIIASIIIVVLIVLGITVAYDYNLSADSDDKEVISVGCLPSTHDAALYVAIETGMFEDEGLEVELHEYNNGGDLVSAMASGEIDVGYLGTTPVLSGIQQGVPIKIVGVAQTEGSGLVTNDPSITNITDLEGKTIATPGESSIQYMLLSYELEKNNMSIDDVNITSMKVSSMSDALRTGSIDAMLSYEPYVSIAQDVDNMTLIENSGQIIENHPCCVVVESDSFIQNHKEEAQKVIEIHQEATDVLKENASNCVDYLPDNIISDREVVAQSLDKMNWVGALDEESKDNIRNFMQIEVDMGILNSTISDDNLFYEP